MSRDGKKSTTKKAVAKKKTTKKKTVTRKPRVRFRTVEFDDEKFKVAVVSKGEDLPVQHKIEVAELVCRMYATDKYTLQECLDHVGVTSDSTWYSWRDNVEEIEVLYIEAKRLKDRRYKHRLKNRARTMAERLIDGYTIEVTEREAEPVTVKEGGKEVTKMQTTKIKMKQVVVRPSVKLIESTLYNFDGDNYVRNPEPYQAGNEKLPTEIKVEIVGGSIPPVTREEDINQDI